MSHVMLYKISTHKMLYLYFAPNTLENVPPPFWKQFVFLKKYDPQPPRYPNTSAYAGFRPRHTHDLFFFKWMRLWIWVKKCEPQVWAIGVRRKTKDTAWIFCRWKCLWELFVARCQKKQFPDPFTHQFYY